MTDLERLRALLTDFGVGFVEKDGAITLEAHGGEKVRGYFGFEAIFTFNDDGSFDDVGIWE